jgi:hypothetical protein
MTTPAKKAAQEIAKEADTLLADSRRNSYLVREQALAKLRPLVEAIISRHYQPVVGGVIKTIEDYAFALHESEDYELAKVVAAAAERVRAFLDRRKA